MIHYLKCTADNEAIALKIAFICSEHPDMRAIYEKQSGRIRSVKLICVNDFQRDAALEALKRIYNNRDLKLLVTISSRR